MSEENMQRKRLSKDQSLGNVFGKAAESEVKWLESEGETRWNADGEGEKLQSSANCSSSEV